MKSIRRYGPVALVLVTGCLLSAAAFMLVDKIGEAQRKADFMRAADDRIFAVRRAIDQDLEVLRSLASFMDSAGDIDRERFHSFVTPALSRHPSIQALEWIPRVSAAERDAYEQSARNDGFAGFQISERQSQGLMVPAGRRAVYYPVFYVEPYQGNELALGFDLASNAARLEALEASRDSGLAQASGPITLVQESEQQYGFLAYAPIYRAGEPHDTPEQRRANLEGFALAVFRVGEMIAGAFEERSSGRFPRSGGIKLLVYDDDGVDGAPRLLHVYPPDGSGDLARDRATDDPGMTLRVSRTFGVAGRNWTIVARPVNPGFGRWPAWEPWAVLGAGLAFTILLVAYLVFSLNRARAVETLVGQRTADLRRANDKAEQALRTKSAFVAMMSHEVRTPMNGVLGALGLLRDGRLGEEQQALVATALDSGEGLLAILNDILDVSKLEAGRLELETTNFELAALVNGVVDLQASHAAAKGIGLDSTIRLGTPAHLAGDPGRIRQVLHNLVSNAVKFTANGRVSIVVSGELRQADGGCQLRVEVADTGIGIPDDRLGELFTEFTQLDVSYARRFGGTGLGLSISKKLVDLMGGEIGVTSREGEGSRFWFSIPLGIAADGSREVQFEAPSVVPSRAEPFEPHKARLLLAEDNTANQMVARLMLRDAGYQLDIVGNGLEAVEAVTNRPYDLVLMDAAMPEMDGLEATRRIRALTGPRADIPIIATTANAMSGDREACLAAGMTGYLAKPFDKASLVAAVRGALAPDKAPILLRQDDPELIDREALHGLARDIDAGALGEIIECFIDDAEGRVARLVAAAEHADVAALEHESHALSSSCATFGAKRLGEIVEAIEQACRAGDGDAAASLGSTVGDVATMTFAWYRQMHSAAPHSAAIGSYQAAS